jgi:hypothetical protein
VTDKDDKKPSPSTLEKAVEKGSNDSKGSAAADKPASRATAAAAPKSETPKQAAPKKPRNVGRSAARMAVGVLVLLVVLAGSYISWPLWGSAMPGWLQTSLAPVMEAGRREGLDESLRSFSDKIATLDTSIVAIKSDLEARPRYDPARFLAADEAVAKSARRIKVLEEEMVVLRHGLAGASRSDALSALEKRLSDTEARLIDLAARPSGPTTGNAGGNAGGGAKALDALRSQATLRMSALEKDNVALRNVVAALDRRLGAIEKRPVIMPGSSHGNALVLAVGQLREAARGPARFDSALTAVSALAGKETGFQDSIGLLKRHAEKGVADLTELRLDFDRIAGSIAHEAFVPKGEGWVDKTLRGLARMVNIRRTGGDAAKRDDENGRVARAELRLAAGDLAGAVKVLEGLTGTATDIAAPWLRHARARIAVDAAIRSLFAEALRQTSDKGTPGG